MHADVDWVVLPARTGATDAANRIRFTVFVAPRLGVDEGEAVVQSLAAYRDWLDWPTTLGQCSFGIKVDGREPVPATLVSTPSSALWQRMFGASTRVQAFVREPLDQAPVATWDAPTVVEDILEGYVDLAMVEPETVEPWDETFWEPGAWKLPEPAEPGMEWVPDVGLEEEVPAEIGELVTEGPATPGELVGPRIIDLFPDLGHVVLEPDNPLAWRGAGEDEFLLANSSAFLAPEELTERAVPISETFDAQAEWQRFAAVSMLSVLRSAEAVETVEFEPVEVTEMAEVAEETTRERVDRQYDFHAIVAALGEHGELLRALGLVLDLECAADAVPADATAVRLALLEVPMSLIAMRHHRMATRVVATPTGLTVPSRADDELRRLIAVHDPALFAPVGLLPVADRCRIEQFDFEGAARRLLQLAHEEVTNGLPQGDKNPTLRTAGLRLVYRDAAEELAIVAATKVVAESEDGGQALSVEDVRRGSRVDVLDETTGRWLSLHRRRVSYRIGGEDVIPVVEDEGLIHVTAATRSVPPGTGMPENAPVTINDALAAWDGWSLSAARPGRVVSNDVRGFDPEFRENTGATVVTEVQNEALTSCGLSIETSVLPGTLPRLRFGRSYRMRLRTVDFAGGSLDLTSADEACADPAVAAKAVTSAVVFRRYEPVPPPDVTFVEAAPAEGVDRSGETERRLVVRSGLADDEQVFGPTPGVSERLLVPPGCSVTMAEWHGVFDDAVGLGAAPGARQTAYELAGTEAGVVTPGVTTTPHLPDPASAGITLWDLPGLPAGETFTVNWPRDTSGRPQPLVLRLEGIPADAVRIPEIDFRGRIVTVFLAAGERAAAKVASRVTDLDLLALPHIWAERRDAEALATARARAEAGTHPQLTPAVVLELVHAVPRPIVAPSPRPGRAIDVRSVGDTHVTIIREWDVDARSTSTVILTARWTRPRDDLAPPGTPAAGAEPDILVDFNAPYTEAFTTTAGRPTVVAVPAAGEPPNAVITVAATGGDGPATLDLGFTGRVRLELRAEATTRFFDFFPASFRQPLGDLPDHFTVASAWEQVVAPNTAKPPEPIVTDVLPLLVHREEGGDPDQPLARLDRTWVREGGWLRVWLARPWFMTGHGELPAIVAVGDTQPDSSRDPRHRYATLVAPDPARGERLRGRVGKEIIYGGWPAEDWIGFDSVDLVGREDFGDDGLVLSRRGVHFDPDRDAWYFDVRVDLPSLAAPFVRLALLRDQPESIPDAARLFGIRCSEVVVLDPITVLPERRLHLLDTGSGLQVELRGPHPPYYADPDGNVVENVGPSVEVSLQRRIADGDPLLSWETVRSTFLGDDPNRALDPANLNKIQEFPYEPTHPAGDHRLLVVERDFSYSIRGDLVAGDVTDRIVYAETVPIPRAVVL